MKEVKINSDHIRDWDSFHREFNEVFGFPDFYGNNMDAWIDCMTCLDDPDAGLSKINVHSGEILVLELNNVESFKQRYSEQYDALISCVAFVNYRRIEQKREPILTFSFC